MLNLLLFVLFFIDLAHGVTLTCGVPVTASLTSTTLSRTYTLTLPVAQQVTLTTCASVTNFDTMLDVNTGQFADDDDSSCAYATTDSTISATFPTGANTIVINGYQSAYGSYQLSATCSACGVSTTGSAFANGNAGTCTNVAIGATCAEACNTGYSVSGSLSRTCQKYTNYTARAATCNLITCPALSAVPVNGATGTCNVVINYGTTCTAACSTGYTISGNASYTCPVGGTLQPVSGSGGYVCNPVQCTSLGTLPTNAVAGNCVTPANYATSCKLQCASGFNATGSATISCLATGSFNASTLVCTDYNECLTNNGGCGAGYKCQNSPGSYSCVDINECLNTTSCHTNATCTNYPGGFSCACNAGFSGDGFNCTAVPLCPTLQPCQGAGSVCTDTPGSYLCSCKSGYSGTGYSASPCTDIDECKNATSCNTAAQCVNLPGSWICGPYILPGTIKGAPSSTMGGSITFTVQAGATNISISTISYGPSTSPLTYHCNSFTTTLVVAGKQNVTCVLAPGVGQNLAFSLTTCYQTSTCSTSPSGTDKFSYPNPTILPGTLRFAAPGSNGSTSLATTNSLGDRIAFDGTNFLYDPSVHVYFGPASNPKAYTCDLLSQTNYTTIVCNTQAYASGTNIFSVVIGSASVNGTDTLVYPDAPVIYKVMGCSNFGNYTYDCPTTGQVAITVVGDAFYPPTGVFVGGVPCAVADSNLTTLVVSLPVGTGFNQSVVVTANKQFSPAVNYVSYAAPQITTLVGCSAGNTSLEIVQCARNGQDLITLTGTNFGVDGATVLIGASTCANVTHDTVTPHTRVTCRTQQGNQLSESVILLQKRGEFSRGTVLLSYQQCAPGTYQSVYSCLPCPNGTSSLVLGATSCLPCFAGYYSIVNPSNGTQICTPCQIGNYQPNPSSSACVSCPNGTYQDTEGQSYCKLCPPGTFSNVTGSQQCMPCSPGKFQSNQSASTCMNCGAGEYIDVESQSYCKPCPVGYFTNTSGNDLCDLCPAGKFQNTTKQSFCYECDTGRTSNVQGQFACDLCQPGSFMNRTGETQCDPCLPGFYQSQNGQSFCVPCEAGKVAESGNQQLCKDCPAGYYTNETQQETCSACSQGYYQDTAGQSQCTACDAGTYTDTTGQQLCKDCPAGFFSNDTTTITCQPCGTGSYLSVTGQTVCVACSAGTYTDVSGQQICKACPAGQFSDLSGLDYCKQCAMGTYSAISGATSCVSCEPGYFSDGNGFQICKSCPGGRYGTKKAATICDDCPVGYYQDTVGQTLCTQCPVGRYVDFNGTLVCKDCAPGYYSSPDSNVSRAACEPCSRGYYQDNSGQTNCSLCEIGRASGDAAPTCEVCGENTFAPNPGSTSCSSCGSPLVPSADRTRCLCPRNYFSSTVNSTLCEKCPTGAICDAVGLYTETLGVESGYWRENNHSLDFFQCLLPAHCPGTPSGGYTSSAEAASMCAANRGGPLCATCSPGYTTKYGTNSCSSCPQKVELSGLLALFIILILIGLGIMYYTVLNAASNLYLNDQEEMAAEDKERKGDTSPDPNETDGALSRRKSSKGDPWYTAREMMQVTDSSPPPSEELRLKPTFTFNLKILLGFFQIATALTAVSDILFPTYYRTFLGWFFWINLQFIPWVQVECVKSISYYARFVVTTLAPLAVIFIASLIFFVPIWCMNRRDWEDDPSKRLKRREYKRKFIRCILFTFFLIYPSISTTVLGYFGCRDVEGVYYLVQDFHVICYTSEWYQYLPYVIVMLFVYPIGVPLGFFFVLWRFRHRLKEPPIAMALGFLYEAYRTGFWWFEMADMCHKLLMTAVLGLIGASARLQVGLTFTSVFTLMILLTRPYLRGGDDKIHLLVQSIIFLLLTSALTFQSAGKLDEVMDIIVSIFLIIITIALFVLFVIYVVKYVRKRYWKFLHKKMAAFALREELEGTQGSQGSQAELTDPNAQRSSEANLQLTRENSQKSTDDLSEPPASPGLP